MLDRRFEDTILTNEPLVLCRRLPRMLFLVRQKTLNFSAHKCQVPRMILHISFLLIYVNKSMYMCNGSTASYWYCGEIAGLPIPTTRRYPSITFIGWIQKSMLSAGAFATHFMVSCLPWRTPRLNCAPAYHHFFCTPQQCRRDHLNKFISISYFQAELHHNHGTTRRYIWSQKYEYSRRCS